MLWFFEKHFLQQIIQRRSKRNRQVKKVFKLQRDACDSITLWSAGGVSFQGAGPTTAKAWFRIREVPDYDIRRSQRSAERSGRVERADSGLDMSSQRYFGARPCWDLATRNKTLYLTHAKIGNQSATLHPQL